MPIQPPPSTDVARLIDEALAEDGGGTDLTSRLTARPDQTGAVDLVARRGGVFAGQAVCTGFIGRFGRSLHVELSIADGERFEAGARLGSLQGPLRTLGQVERPLLNFLGRLCGVASLTRRYVQAVAGTPAEIYDTRKTIPGWRTLDKYAVRCGGGCNHRMGLHDAVLVKDNHLAAVPADELERFVGDLAARARRLSPAPAFVEIEVDSLEQLDAVLAARGVDVILLDNFAPQDLQRAVARRNRSGSAALLEASGGITLDNVSAVAATGVDRIAIGALTHSATGVDLGFDASSCSSP